MTTARITYDSKGKCTRCGSIGYYLSSYTSDSSFEDMRTCIKSCPCHGWRPVSCYKEGRVRIFLKSAELEVTAYLKHNKDETWWEDTESNATYGFDDVDFWQPTAEPPEVV